jgi:hypothetical protein
LAAGVDSLSTVDPCFFSSRVEGQTSAGNLQDRPLLLDGNAVEIELKRISGQNTGIYRSIQEYTGMRILEYTGVYRNILG